MDDSDLLKVLRERLERDSPLPNAGKELGRQFAELDDEQQADFFQEVGLRFKDFPEPGNHDGYMQILGIATHMVACPCVDDRGLRWVRDLNDAIEHYEGRLERGEITIENDRLRYKPAPWWAIAGGWLDG